MDEPSNRVSIEGIHWRELFPFLHLFGSFRMAIHPAKLLLALGFVAATAAVGGVVDRVFDRHVYYPGEREQLAEILAFEHDPSRGERPLGLPAWRRKATEDTRRRVQELMWQAGVKDDVGGLLDSAPDMFNTAATAIHDAYVRRYDDAISPVEATDGESEAQAGPADGIDLVALRRQRSEAMGALAELRPRGIIAELMAYKRDRLTELVRAAATMNFGWRATIGGAAADTGPAAGPSVLGALQELCVGMPRWVFRAHTKPALVMLVAGSLLWALFGGTLARLTALHTTRGEAGSLRESFRFGRQRFFWFLLAPIIPLLFALLLAGLLALGGLVANLWVLDILVGIFYLVALAGGAVIALVLVGLIAGHNLLLPAIAVEGTDAFDAISRVYNYALSRPWRTIFYNGVALVYGAATCLFVALIVCLAMHAARIAVGWGHMTQASGLPLFEAMVPGPRPGGIVSSVDWEVLGWSASLAAGAIACWHWLLLSGLLAYGLSLYVSASTWVYLLLRRAADDTEFDDVWSADVSERNAEGLADAPPMSDPPVSGP